MLKYILVAIALSSWVGFASGAGLTDTDVHSRPASPPAFGADHKTTDPTFGTTIVRVTGAVGSNAVYATAETQNLAPIQHFHNPWNCTGDMFLVWADQLSTGSTGAGNDLYSVDASTFTVSRVRRVSTPANVMNYNRGIKWATNPAVAESDRKWIVYAVNTGVTPNTIQRWNLDTSSAHDGLAANTSEVLKTDSEGIDQLTMSSNDDRFSYYTANKKVKVWVRSTDTTYTADLNSWSLFDESQMTPDGLYVFVKGHEVDGQDYTVRFDYTMNNPVNYSSYTGTPPDDFAGKHSGHGEWWVNETAQSGYRLAKRRPGDGKGTPSYIFSTAIANGSMHPSYSTVDYVYGGMFRTSAYDSSKVYLDEILKIKTDGSSVVRLAHAWSNFYSTSFDEIPSFASADNRFVLFYSNWNGADINARHDVFLIDTGASVGSGTRYRYRVAVE